MKRVFFVLLGIIILSIGNGCISFKIIPLSLPASYVDTFCVCKEIEDKGDLLSPNEISDEFNPEDKNILCFIKLKEVSQQIRLRWKWYSPDKKVFRDTGDVIVNQAESYLKAITAYDNLKIEPAAMTSGQWTVVIFLNDKLIGRKEFQINLDALN